MSAPSTTSQKCRAKLLEEMQRAKMPGENQQRLKAIICNDDNTTQDNIVSVCTDAAITALTDDGIREIKDMLAAARRSTKDRHDVLSHFAANPDTITHSKNHPPQQHPAGYDNPT